MNREEIIQLRLFNQGLSTNCFEKPDQVVAHFGAMQAQDYSMALWAVGLRMKSPNRSAVEDQINSGEIIRTHILRPTWHLVHQRDIRWMMELSSPNVKKATQYIDKQEGLTDELFIKAWKIIEHQFNEVDNLTKEDIVSSLSKQHITVSNLLATQFIIRAELEMLLCNGEKKGTYALFEKRVPKADRISKSEAITRLAQLYFKSRGPATLRDFAWWSGLSMSDAKIGIAELGKRLEYITYQDLKYYYFQTDNNLPEKTTFALLPCYDEYTVGYSEGRTIVLPTFLDNSKTGNGIFKPIILSENEIAGIWRKSKKSPLIEVQPFIDNKEIPKKTIEEHSEMINLFSS
jgi:hypothetical protein